MKKKESIFFTVVVLFITAAFSQNNIQKNNTLLNYTDIQGNKQGRWIKKYDNGNIRYEGYFINNKPVGEFKRYYQDSALQSVLTYDKFSRTAYAKIYHEDGKTLQAEGKYINTQRDSLWKYYDITSMLISEEYFKAGKKDGVSKVFFVNGKVFEELTWKDSIKNGVWRRYTEECKKELETVYKNGELNGLFYIYHDNGRLKIKGAYKDDLKEGKWIFSDENGKVEKEVEYIKGRPVNEDEWIKKQTEEIKKYMEQKGKIPEPSENKQFKDNQNE